MELLTGLPIALPSLPDDCLPEGRIAVDLGSMDFDHTNPTLTYEFDTQGFSPTKPISALRTLFFDCQGITAGAVVLSIPSLSVSMQLLKQTQGFIPILVPTLPQVLKFSGLNIGATVTDGTFRATLYNFVILNKIWTVIT